MTTRRIVLDANILIRAVLGNKVRKLITAYADEVDFGAPEVAFRDAAEHLPHIAADRDVDPGPWLESLNALKDLVAVLTVDQAEHLREPALRRIGDRDSDDWPIVATALALNCPIWTEDKDFFGIGIPIWKSDHVEIYLKGE